jgi:ABC-type multidrug transport system ATPase subunit
VLNAAAMNDGKPPEVLSSFPGVLAHVVVIDNQGRAWTCDGLAPGRKQTCIAGTRRTAYNRILAAHLRRRGRKTAAPARRRPRISAAASTRSAIPIPRARACPRSARFNWDAVQGIYLGPWVAAPATGNGRMSDEIILDVRNLRRSFGNVHAVQDVSFTIRKGQVVGFIGANGAGKTTTLRLLATLDTPDAGSIEIMGCEATDYPDKVRARLGWMPDSYGNYDNVTVVEYLDFYARSYGYTGAQRTKHVNDIMDFTELTPIQDRLMHTLSKGMGQRLCLGRSLINEPELLLMDEPAAGLDPKARIEFKNLVRILSQQGKTILISSHILSELGEMCDTMLFIDKGRIVHHG